MNDVWRSIIICTILDVRLPSLDRVCKRIADEVKQNAINEHNATTFICAIGAKA